MKKLILLASISLVLQTSLYAQTSPRVLSYQGVIRSSGNAFVGSHSLMVTLYGDASGTIKLWQGILNTPIDSSGVFNCLLGTSDNPLPSSTVMDQPLWLGVAVDSSDELRPLSQMTASLYALNVVDNSVTSAKLTDASVTTSKLADSSVTSSKLNLDYVSSISVNGTQVTGNGTALNITGSEGINVLFDPNTNNLYLSGAGPSVGSGKGDHPLSAGNHVAWWNGVTSTDGGTGFTNNVLHGDGGGSGSPFYGPVNLGTDVSGLLPFANGGTEGIPKWTGGTGTANVASGSFSTVGGGDSNTAFGSYSDVGGGHANYAGYWTSVSGGVKNWAEGSYEFIGAGQNNLIQGSNSSAIVAGMHNYIEADYPDTNENFIGAGEQNIIEPDGSHELDASSIVGGLGNKIYEGPGFIGGGEDNIITQEWVSVVGGLGNIDSNDMSFIGGGARNKILGADINLPYSVAGVAGDTFGIMASAIVAGFQNLINLGGFDFIGAGWRNTTAGEFSTIPGGYGMKLGAFSFGFNGESPQYDTAITDLSNSGAALSQVAYFGNVNMMIGNVDNSARALQFYSPQTSHTYSGAKYSSFQAGDQTSNIIYTLPTVPPDTLGWVLGVGSISGTHIGLQWQLSDTGSAGGGGGIPAWYQSGNTGTTAGPNFLGTIDNMAMEIHVHDGAATSTGGNKRVMQYSEGATSPNILGGSSANTIHAGLSGVGILSGGTEVMPNIINDSFSVVAGGDGNKIDTDADHAFIGGGRNNYINGLFSMIGGGEDNIIAADSADHNVIAEGLGNIELDPSFGVISGGAFNYLGWDSWSSAIGGGWNDSIFTNWATIGGGAYNFIDGYCTGSTIAGGDSNRIGSAGYAFIGGGFHNKAWGEYTTIGGGYRDSTFGLYSFLGGGQKGYIDFNSTYSVLVGGDSNKISGPRSIIVGGCFNTVSSTEWGTIVGGCGNKVSDTLTFVGGGDSNLVAATRSTIGGGTQNKIAGDSAGTSQYGFIGGGQQNAITDADIWTYAVSGEIDTPIVMPQHASIAGGLYNHAEGQFSSIGGGRQNYALGIYASVPGGIGLVAEDYQTVIGRFNAWYSGGFLLNSNSINKLPYGSTHIGNDTAEWISWGDYNVFIIGNGSVNSAGGIAPSDAFEVSDDGHSVVHDINGNTNDTGTLTPRTPYYGGTYQDNTISAWGDIPASGGLTTFPDPITTNADFGVLAGSGVSHTDTGVYVITISLKNNLYPYSSVTLSHASITVTPEDNNIHPTEHETGCITATCSQIGIPGPNQFIVRTYFNCVATDEPFFFKVAGRP